jgi:hypothetical protein
MSCSSYASSNQCTLAPAASGTIDLAFAPTAAGAQSATLSLGIGSTTTDVPLTGNGVNPATVTPTSLAFGTRLVGTTSLPQTITITNNDAIHPLTVGVPLFLGDFSIASNSMSCSSYVTTNECTLDPGGSGTIGIVFTPSAIGGASATLALGTGSTITNVALSGAGL